MEILENLNRAFFGSLENPNRLIYEAFMGFRSHAYATHEKIAKQDKGVLLTAINGPSPGIAGEPSAPDVAPSTPHSVLRDPYCESPLRSDSCPSASAAGS